jgi:metal-responsive CopG/Arc/MetJ family transcriptional regulator
MGAIRLNVTLPDDIIKALKEFSGPREQSAFIAKSVRFYIEKLKKDQLKESLIEGYKATALEDLALNEEFEHLADEGLDENY